MKKRTIFLLLIIPTVILPFCVRAQQVVISSPYLLYRPAVNDLRAKGMGNTEVLSPDPVNGGLSNPALIADHVGVGFSLGMNRLSGSNDIEGLNQGSYDFYRIDHEGDTRGNNLLSHASIVLTKNEPERYVTMGFFLSYQKLYSANKMERNELCLHINDQISCLTTNYIQEERYSFISLGFAFKIKSISMGFSLNNGVKNNNHIDEYDYRSQWSHYDFSTDSTTSESYMDHGNNGYPSNFISVGAKFDYKRIKVGLIYRGKWSTENDVCSIPLISPNPNIYNKLIKSYNRFPSILGFSLSYSLLDNLTLVGEYQTRSFSINNFNQKAMEDGDVKRFGIEYIPLDDLFIRAGYFRENIMVFDYNSQSPETLSGFTAGLGIKKSIITVDLALEYGKYEQILDGSSLLKNYTMHLRNKSDILTVGSSITLHF